MVSTPTSFREGQASNLSSEPADQDRAKQFNDQQGVCDHVVLGSFTLSAGQERNHTSPLRRTSAMAGRSAQGRTHAIFRTDERPRIWNLCAAGVQSRGSKVHCGARLAPLEGTAHHGDSRMGPAPRISNGQIHDRRCGELGEREIADRCAELVGSTMNSHEWVPI